MWSVFFIYPLPPVAWGLNCWAPQSWKERAQSETTLLSLESKTTPIAPRPLHILGERRWWKLWGAEPFSVLQCQAEGQLVSLLLPEGRRRVISLQPLLSSWLRSSLLSTQLVCAGLDSHWCCTERWLQPLSFPPRHCLDQLHWSTVGRSEVDLHGFYSIRGIVTQCVLSRPQLVRNQRSPVH